MLAITPRQNVRTAGRTDLAWFSHYPGMNIQNPSTARTDVDRQRATRSANSSTTHDEAQQRESLSWLTQLARIQRRWLWVAVAAGLLQTTLTIGFAWWLADTLHALVMAGSPLLPLPGSLLVLTGLLTLRAVAGVLREEAGLRASRGVRDSLRVGLIDHSHTLGPAWHAGQTGGALTSQMLEQLDGIDGYIARYLPQRWLAVLSPLMIVVAVSMHNAMVALILIATAPLIPLFMSIVGHSARRRQQQQLDSLTRMSGQFLETLRGLTTLRLLNAHHAYVDRVSSNAESFRERTMSVLRVAFLSSAVLEFFTALSIALTAVYLGFGLLGELDIGFGGERPTLFMAFFLLLLAPEFYLPLRELGTHYHARAEALATAAHLKPWLDTPAGGMTGGSRLPSAQAPTIVAEALTLRHAANSPAALDKLSFTIKAGTCLAITGASGTGKTTLIRLLLGQYSPDSGRILIDGVTLDQLDARVWRERIGWMSQHPRLISGSVADNLRLACQAASEPAMLAALDFAGLGEWLRALPNGLQTRLGEGGRSLSGGQLRRLALARVRLRPATVLLLDEPTASLDEDTEALVVSRLAQLCQGRTVVLLTHRQAPLAIADQHLSLTHPCSSPEAKHV